MSTTNTDFAVERILNDDIKFSNNSLAIWMRKSQLLDPQNNIITLLRAKHLQISFCMTHSAKHTYTTVSVDFFT